MEINSSDSETPLRLDGPSLRFLYETARWGKFLAIIGFVGIGIMIIAGLMLGTMQNQFNSPLLTMIPMKSLSLFYILFAALYLVPVINLYRFSIHMKAALREQDQQHLTVAFSNMKSLFRFMGIMAIVVISMYLIVIISAIIFGVINSV